MGNRNYEKIANTDGGDYDHQEPTTSDNVYYVRLACVFSSYSKQPFINRQYTTGYIQQIFLEYTARIAP